MTFAIALAGVLGWQDAIGAALIELQAKLWLRCCRILQLLFATSETADIAFCPEIRLIVYGVLCKHCPNSVLSSFPQLTYTRRLIGRRQPPSSSWEEYRRWQVA